MTNQGLSSSLCLFGVYFLIFIALTSSTKKDDNEKENVEGWKKKNIRDYSDADMERLFEQWEVVKFTFLLTSLYFYNINIIIRLLTITRH